jgi:hypothetical protein
MQLLSDVWETFVDYVFHPATGTRRHDEWRYSAIKACHEEEAKPPELRNPDKLRRLRRRALELTIENTAVSSRQAEMLHSSVAAVVDDGLDLQRPAPPLP